MGLQKHKTLKRTKLLNQLNNLVLNNFHLNNVESNVPFSDIDESVLQFLGGIYTSCLEVSLFWTYVPLICVQFIESDTDAMKQGR